jgi:hypothetical protein
LPQGVQMIVESGPAAGVPGSCSPAVWPVGVDSAADTSLILS